MKISKVENQVSRKIEDETIILNLSTGIYYTLNQTGSAIWSLINGKNSPGVIAGKIASEYKIDKEKALREVERLIKDLSQEDLVKRKD